MSLCISRHQINKPTKMVFFLYVIKEKAGLGLGCKFKEALIPIAGPELA